MSGVPARGERGLARQFGAFSGVGLVAAVVHYGLLAALVEFAGIGAVPAALAGYTAGGIVSYWLNRRYTYRSDRPHAEAGWRFALVAGTGFVLTGLLMALFVDGLAVPYLAAQLATTLIVLAWHFVAHKVFTFGA